MNLSRLTFIILRSHSVLKDYNLHKYGKYFMFTNN